MTKTKLAETDSTRIRLLNPYFQIYTSNCTETQANVQPSSLGTTIAVKKDLQPYIHNIKTYLATSILVDFHFPKNKNQVISTYLPHNNPILLCMTQDQITSWIIKAMQKKYKILVMGDFNCNANKKKNKLPLFYHMGNCNLTSTLNFFDITQHTWFRESSHSQIDDIWAFSHMIAELLPPMILSSVKSTSSDHEIVTVFWNHSINTALSRTKKCKCKIFHYDKMNNETWVNFAESISQNLTKANIDMDSLIVDTSSLNKLWHKLNLAIKVAVNTHILFAF